MTGYTFDKSRMNSVRTESESEKHIYGYQITEDFWFENATESFQITDPETQTVQMSEVEHIPCGSVLYITHTSDDKPQIQHQYPYLLNENLPKKENVEIGSEFVAELLPVDSTIHPAYIKQGTYWRGYSFGETAEYRTSQSAGDRYRREYSSTRTDTFFRDIQIRIVTDEKISAEFGITEDLLAQLL